MLLLSSWLARTPDVRDLFGASTAEMGLVLFGLSVGSMIGVLGSGPFVTRFGARPVITDGVSSLLIGVPVIAQLLQSVVVAAGLFLCGFGIGCCEFAQTASYCWTRFDFRLPGVPHPSGPLIRTCSSAATCADDPRRALLPVLVRRTLLGEVVDDPPERGDCVGGAKVPPVLVGLWLTPFAHTPEIVDHLLPSLLVRHASHR